ncbi:hypothetical protein J4425_00385 [Candidatus Woesearchaeota archaeon]|nr:hypothetical protein [Candidatus Woesearchaeota archaeon]
MKNSSKAKNENTEFYVQLGIMAILALVIVFNVGRIYSENGIATGVGIVSASEIIPKGMPAVYGVEIGVRYDDISAGNPGLADATIRKLSQYEDMDLNQEQMARYIGIGSSISCEYCCGAKAIIFSNGERACGCAHSYAMRGVAKYLLINHPEMSNEEILSELGKWKVLFFPGIHEQKADILKANGVDFTNYINLASNLYRGIEQGQTSDGQMVGGC